MEVDISHQTDVSSEPSQVLRAMKDHNSNSPVHKANMTSPNIDTDVVTNDHSVIANSVPVPTSIATTATFPVNKNVTKHVTYGDSTVVFMTPEQSPMTPDIGVQDLLATEMSRSSQADVNTQHVATGGVKRGQSPSRMVMHNNNYYTNNINNNSSSNINRSPGSTGIVAVASRRNGSTSPGSRQHYSTINATETKTEIKPAHYVATTTDTELAGFEPRSSTGLYGRTSRRSPTPPPVVMRTSATSLDRLSWKGYRSPSEEYYDVLHPEPKDQT